MFYCNGKIMCKWAMASIATLNNQRVLFMMFMGIYIYIYGYRYIMIHPMLILKMCFKK